MEYSSLYDLITFLQQGTKLHIGVLFFGNYGNKKCTLPHSHQIHMGKICDYYKAVNEKSFRRCLKCRNMAVNKALTEKNPFGGLCINGVYEYLRPVLIGKEVACVIFIGNIFMPYKRFTRMKNKSESADLFAETLEQDFDESKCETLGILIESYIRILLEKYESADTSINPLIENIKSYINANLEAKIELSHIAEVFHYNKTYLGRLFRKETGKTVSEYINEKRLVTAKALLENTDDSIISISVCTGFNNVTYFNRLYKSRFGVTPSQSRKKRDIQI